MLVKYNLQYFILITFIHYLSCYFIGLLTTSVPHSFYYTLVIDKIFASDDRVGYSTLSYSMNTPNNIELDCASIDHMYPQSANQPSASFGVTAAEA